MDWLKGKQVAFTGRLASMTRKQAASLLAAHGAVFAQGVTRQTSALVVGQEGWPLDKNGRLTAKLQKARKLPTINILGEAEFLGRLGNDGEGIHRLFTLAQLSSLLKVPGRKIRAWIDAGLILPVDQANGLCYFDFQQVVGAKTLCELAQAGVSTERLRRSLRQLRQWLGEAGQPWHQLALLEKNGQILMRWAEGLVEPSGQGQFDFTAAENLLPAMPTRTAADWFDLGCRHEEAARLDQAADAYRQALLQGGPDAVVSFNLANVLYALGRLDQACERFYQVLELDRHHAEAWHNLGTVLGQLQKYEEATQALQQAIALGYADAYYNLADLLDEQGRSLEAQPYWQAFLRHDPGGPWARYARSKLG